MNYLQILQRLMHSFTAVIASMILLAGCSESVEESAAYEESPAYQAACHGAPLRSVEQREKALEDGYSVNPQYDCIDKASFEATEKQKVEWEAAHTPEAIAKRDAEFAAQRERELAIMSGGQPLWDRTLDGMTVEEVRKAYPKAKDNPGAEYPVNQLVDGSKSLLKLPDVKINGLVFVASFDFLNEKLIQVRLHTEGSGKQIEKARQKLVDSFQAKYGSPHTENSISQTNSRWDEAWINNATRIKLSTSIFKTPDNKQYGTGEIRIIYRVRPLFFDSNLKK